MRLFKRRSRDVPEEVAVVIRGAGEFADRLMVDIRSGINETPEGHPAREMRCEMELRETLTQAAMWAYAAQRRDLVDWLEVTAHGFACPRQEHGVEEWGRILAWCQDEGIQWIETLDASGHREVGTRVQRLVQVGQSVAGQLPRRGEAILREMVAALEARTGDRYGRMPEA